MRTLAGPALLALLSATEACRARDAPRAEVASDAATAAPESPRAQGASNAIVPVRAAEGSQPRWRSLARGARPRGRERWRMDLTPRQPYGEIATDGITVYIAAVRDEPEGPTDGAVYAFDLDDGTIRWHTALGGLHGEPLELIDGVLVVDTIPHCKRRGPETPGVLTRPCEESGPGAVVGLDAATGRERFRAPVSSDALRARWTAAQIGAAVWVHDGPSALRPLSLPAWGPAARVAAGGAVLNLPALGGDALYTVRAPNGATRLVRRGPGVARPRWERALPLHTHCPAVSSGPVTVLPAFQSSAVTGAARALLGADGADLWSAPAPQRVGTCGAIEGGAFYQVVDDAIVAYRVIDGRQRARLALPVALTSDMAALMDGVLYLSARGRLAGVDLINGHVSVSVDTGATACESAVLWGGRGVVATRDPGLVVGFE
jgi:outer membrane protein assembly factor BamB